MTEQELEARIVALGRPESVFAPWAALTANIKAKAAWDAAHPEMAREYHRLVGEQLELRREREAAEVAAAEAHRIKARVADSGVGERSLEALGARRETPAMAAVQSWLEGSRAWLLLLGAKGCGKTVAATWAVDASIRDCRSAVFRRVSEVGKLSSFNGGAEEFERLKRVQVLVLDEVGAEFASDYARSQFHELLDVRHEAKARTILTSNLPKGEIAKRLGERLVDRIAGDGVVVELTGASLRRVS